MMQAVQGSYHTAVAIASNTGALTSFPSSLAGLLWRRILSEKGENCIAAHIPGRKAA